MICIPSESRTVVRKQIEITTSREFTSKEWLEKVVSSSLPSEKKNCWCHVGAIFLPLNAKDQPFGWAKHLSPSFFKCEMS